MENLQQRSATVVNRETEDNPEQDSHHSFQDIHVAEETSTQEEGQDHEETNEPPSSPRKGKLKLPGANSKEWKDIDEDLELTLENTLKGTAKEKMILMPKIVYDVCISRFGTEDRATGTPKKTGPSRRQTEIGNIRRDLRQLKRRWKEAEDSEKEGCLQLRADLRSRLQTLRRAEQLRKKAREKRKARAAFYRDPFKFVGDLLGRPKSGQLQCSQEEMDESIRAAHSDPLKDVPLGKMPNISPAPPPQYAFDSSEITLEEVRNVVKKARSGSAPGPSGITYAIYKRCPKLTRRLWKLMRVLWRTKELPSTWLLAEGCFVPKEENASRLDQFREISLLSVEGKIFWSVIARRLTTYLLKNQYIDVAVQKGGIAGFSGCVEHTSAITNLIQEAKEGKKDLSVVWLDLAKAYPSVPHQLIYIALEHYHVPGDVVNLVRGHLSKINMRFSSGKLTSGWQRLEKGIMAGCTVSVILFVAAMNILLKEAAKECRGPVADNGTRHPPCRAFMDDVTVMAPKEVGTRWILKRLEELATWGRLTFKPTKSRSLIINKGKVSQRTFQMQGETIPSITQNPIKCLGKWFHDSLCDTLNTKSTKEQLKVWLEAISKTTLPGKLKIWCFQHGVIPRLNWPFTMYNFAVSTVESMERLVSRYLRKWLGVPRSFSTINLYSKSSPASIPISSVVEEYKVTGVRAELLLRYSQDHVIQGVKKKTTSKKWTPQRAIEDAESRLKISDVIGTVAEGRKGLGSYGRVPWSKADGKTRRKMIEEEVRKGEEEDRRVRAAAQGKQGAWLGWEGVESRRTTWNEVMKTPDKGLSFLLKAVSDTLPSPTNLARWGLSLDAKCPLCTCDHASLRHILCACPVALKEGRYTWRHDQVLKEIASQIASIPQGPDQNISQFQEIHFLKEGTRSGEKKHTPTTRGLLREASDWEMKVDIGKKLVFPVHMAVTKQRPDIILFSEAAKTVVLVELTVPWEERMEESHELKAARYEMLVEEVRQNGWKVHCFPVEVGCRGFPSRSLRRMWKALGMLPSKIRTACKRTGEEAERCSRWLWLRHKDCWLFQ